MSFTSINGMRSARYPLQGDGCGCGTSMYGLGQTSAVTNWVPWAVGGALLLGVGAASYFALRPIRRNRRRRRR